MAVGGQERRHGKPYGEELLKAVMFNQPKMLIGWNQNGEGSGGEASAFLHRGWRTPGREALPNPPFPFHQETK
jgi:hypothetical protein